MEDLEAKDSPNLSVISGESADLSMGGEDREGHWEIHSGCLE